MMKTDINQRDTEPAQYPMIEAVKIMASRVEETLSQNPRQTVRLEVPVKPLDILAWLGAQAADTRFYFSGRDVGDREVAGIGVADEIQAVDPACFSLVFGHMRHRLSRRYPSLRYYGGFAFSTDHIDEDWQNFGAGRFFIPRFELSGKAGQTFFACNITADEANDTHTDRLLGELKKIVTTGGTGHKLPGKVLSRTDYPDYEQWRENLDAVIAEIKAGQYKKTVLARKVVLDFEQAADPVTLLLALKRLPSRRYDFLFQFDGGSIFLGSSPERLYKRQERQISSEAVAGTRARGKDPHEDDRLAKELMASKKEREEHDFVVHAVEKGLGPLCAVLETDHKKGLLKLKEAQHLVCHFKGTLKPGVNDEMLIAALHPTPAVGGCPLDKALVAISRAEPFKRGWYAGVVGTVGAGGGDFAVALRSAMVTGKRLCLYSGVGVVAGSDPAEEWQEVNGKIANFMDILEHDTPKDGKH